MEPQKPSCRRSADGSDSNHSIRSGTAPKLFQTGHPSLGLFSDEGGGFVGGHGLSAEAKLRTLTGLSQLWDGSTIARVRAGEGSSVVSGKRLSAHLMVQPGVAATLLNDDVAADQGFLSRVLATHPQSTAGTRLYRREAPGTAAALGRYHNHILSILRRPLPLAPDRTNELQPPALDMEPGARALFIELHDATERALGRGGPFEPIRGLANKLAEHALRMAGVLALVENPDASFIGEAHMQSAALLVDHFSGEALRLWDASKVSPEIQNAERLLAWLHSGWPENKVSLTAIYRLGPNTLREKAIAARTVAILEDHGWLARLEGRHTVGGKPVREAWRVVRGTS